MPMVKMSLSSRRLRAAVSLVATVGLAIGGARAIAAGQEPQAPADAPTFRVGTRLATIDAVVVDKDGTHVTDLRPDDFEIVERGKSQTVRQAVYVQVIGPDGRPVPQPPSTLPPRRLAVSRPRRRAAAAARRHQGAGLRRPRHRVIASSSTTSGCRSRALLPSGDAGPLRGHADRPRAIWSPSSAPRRRRYAAAVHDRSRLCHAAIDRVRWSAAEPIGRRRVRNVVPERARVGVQTDRAARTELATFRTLGALEYVLLGSRHCPDAKRGVVVSEGFDLGIRDAG